MTLFEENAEVLRGMERRGVDLSYERSVDFSHVFPTEPDANGFIQACASKGIYAENTTDEQQDQFEVTVSKALTPTSDHITQTEEMLGKLASQHNGCADGWGFFSD